MPKYDLSGHFIREFLAADPPLGGYRNDMVDYVEARLSEVGQLLQYLPESPMRDELNPELAQLLREKFPNLRTLPAGGGRRGAESALTRLFRKGEITRRAVMRIIRKDEGISMGRKGGDAIVTEFQYFLPDVTDPAPLTSDTTLAVGPIEQGGGE